ncbi:MAG TPA: S53 family peptidase, partial [Conexibacter sp.]|nr:S53 family peptidase [Conexibacter sp.]
GHVASEGSTPVAVPAELRGGVADVSIVAPTSLARDREVRASSRPAPARAAAARPLPLQSPADPYNGLPTTTGSAFGASGTPRGCAAARAATSPFGRGFAPNQISTAYGVDRLHRRGLRGEGMRVALIEADGFLHRDLKTFAACFGLRLPPIRTAVVDRRRALPPGPETTLDLEVLIAQAPQLERIDVQQMHSASSDVAGDLLAAVSAALRERPRPDALSLSLDVCEAAIGAPGVPTGSIVAVRALDDLFALAAAAGVSTVVASGDAGSAGCLRESDSVLPSVSFPSSSAWVTAVGGTNVRLDAANRIAREVAWNDTPAAIALFAEQGITTPPAEAVANASGGGRSLLFARPWWQRDAGLPGGARLVPDVSALAGQLPGWVTYCSNRACVESDQSGWSTSGGTSAATPLVAAALTLSSQAARRRGQPPIGFANPLIYRLADGRERSAVLRDVTVGATDVTAAVGRNYHGDRGVLGVYPAGRGYDLATGWGSLVLPAFTDAALAAGRRGAGGR